MRTVRFKVGYDTPDGFSVSFQTIAEFTSYEDAEYYCLNVTNYYIPEIYIKKVYIL